MPSHLPISEHEDASQALKDLDLNYMHADTLDTTHREWCKNAGSTLNCKEKATRIAIAVEKQELFCKDVLLKHAEVGYEADKTDEKKLRVEEAAASHAKTDRFLGILNRMKHGQVVERAHQKARDKLRDGLQMVREAEDAIYRLGKERCAHIKLSAPTYSEKLKKAEMKLEEVEIKLKEAEDKAKKAEGETEKLRGTINTAKDDALDDALDDLEKEIKKKIKKMRTAK